MFQILKCLLQQPFPSQHVLLMLSVLVSLSPVGLTSVWCQESLSDQQAAQLKQAKSSFRRIQANVNLAKSTAGTGDGPLKGSRARLTKVRLGSSPLDLPKVQKLVADLPASNSEVAEFMQELQSTEETIEQIEARLAGKTVTKTSKPAPEKAKPTESVPTISAGADSKNRMLKLDYRQKETLKGAQYNLREVNGGLADLESVVSKFKPMKDQLAVPHRIISSRISILENARRKLGFAKKACQNLPDQGDGVASFKQEIQEADRRLEQAAQYLTLTHETLSKLIDPKAYPELAQDVARVQGLTQMFGNPMILLTDFERAADYVTQLEPSQKEVRRIASKYNRLIQQQSADGQRLEKLCAYFEKKRTTFDRSVQQQKTQLPGRIQQHLSRCQELATQAVEKKKPLFFTGGIPQELGFANQKWKLLQAIDTTSAAKIKSQMEQLQQTLKQSEAKLASDIIRNNRMPNDRYRGTDRQQVIGVAIDAWKHQEKKFKVLAKRIPAEAWSRETMWQYSNGTWYFVDRSKLQVHLMIADSKEETQAIMRPVTVIRDHQKGDAMIGTPLWSIDDQLSPKSYLLRKNVTRN